MDKGEGVVEDESLDCILQIGGRSADSFGEKGGRGDSVAGVWEVAIAQVAASACLCSWFADTNPSLFL